MVLCSGELGKTASESPEAVATTGIRPDSNLVIAVLLSLSLGGIIGYLIAKGGKKSG